MLTFGEGVGAGGLPSETSIGAAAQGQACFS